MKCHAFVADVFLVSMHNAPMVSAKEPINAWCMHMKLSKTMKEKTSTSQFKTQLLIKSCQANYAQHIGL